jgi:hypothetical protein
MPPGAFPSLATASIRHAHFEELPPEYMVRRSDPFGDGGRDVSIGAQTKVRQFVFRYTGLSTTDRATMDAHKESACYSDREGSAYSFSVTLPRTGEVVANVFYAPGGYKPSHTKYWASNLEVLLIKYP